MWGLRGDGGDGGNAGGGGGIFAARQFQAAGVPLPRLQRAQQLAGQLSPIPPPPADSCPVDLPPGARTNTQQARELKSVQLDAYGRFIKVAQLDRV